MWILLISVFSLYSLLPAGLDMEVSFLLVEVVSLKINTTYTSLGDFGTYTEFIQARFSRTSKRLSYCFQGLKTSEKY